VGKRSKLVIVLCGAALAACGGDMYNPPPQDDTPDDPDAAGADASLYDASLIDAEPDVDALGNGLDPAITIITPQPGSLVSGVVTITVAVADSDGIDDVTATIAGVNEIDMTLSGTGEWSGTYDTVELAGMVFPTINVRARDNADAESELGWEVTLDNRAPYFDLDPPRIRDGRIRSGIFECSESYDPVGEDAPDDGESVAQLIEFRARIRDLPNTGSTTSTVFVPYAGVDDADLYVLDDSDRPLIVDSDGDGVCDMINPQIVPTSVPMSSDEAAVIDLTPVTATGLANFFEIDATAGSNQACNVGSDGEPPSEMCVPADGMTRAAASSFTGVPEVYTIPPTNEINCVGFAFDALASNISDGWACVAIAGGDLVGNTGVSPPLRVCIDHDNDNAEGCPDWTVISPEGARPDCTGTYDPGSGTVTDTPCEWPETFLDFGQVGEYEIIRIDF
jgi:hypothetical protein